MSQTRVERIAALLSLLPLMEAHLSTTGTTARAQWESAYEPPPPGWVPPPPEPDCKGECSHCGDFLMGRRCNLREERWAHEWMHLRSRYPELYSLETLLFMLGHDHARWAAAIYRIHIPPHDWEMWDQDQERALALLGVVWLEERFVGWVPTHVEEPARVRATLSDIARLRAEGLSIREIARAIDKPKSTVHRALERVLNG